MLHFLSKLYKVCLSDVTRIPWECVIYTQPYSDNKQTVNMQINSDLSECWEWKRLTTSLRRCKKCMDWKWQMIGTFKLQREAKLIDFTPFYSIILKWSPEVEGELEEVQV